MSQRRRRPGGELDVIHIKGIRCAGTGQLERNPVEITDVDQSQRAERDDNLLPGFGGQRGRQLIGRPTVRAVLNIDLEPLTAVGTAIGPEGEAGINRGIEILMPERKGLSGRQAGINGIGSGMNRSSVSQVA